jgi:cytochrome P450 family 135
MPTLRSLTTFTRRLNRLPALALAGLPPREVSMAHGPVIDGLPPGPRFPRIVQTGLWGLAPVAFVKGCRRRYGDVFTLRALALGEIVVVADPDSIRQVFAGDRDVFHAGEANALSPVLGEHSLLCLDGDEHLRQRRRMLPPFHGEAVKAYRRRVAAIADAQVRRWPVGEPLAIRDRMRAIALEVILQAVIGVRDPERLERLRELMPRLLDFSLLDMLAVRAYPKLVDSPIGRRHRSQRIRPEVDGLLFAEIADHRASPEGRDDILAMLIKPRDGEDPLSDDELHDQLVTLLLAGHETTTTALAWCFERLVRHPEVLARLQDELATHESDEYLDAVVNETLRVRPVIDAVWRKLTAPAEVARHRLPAGTRVVPSIVLVQRSEAYREPEAFRPERFLESSAAPYTLIPFGGGPRRCIGASFAVMEMKTIIRTVLSSIELRAADPKPERVRLQHITLVPDRGAEVIVTARTPAAEDHITAADEDTPQRHAAMPSAKAGIA